MADSPAKSVAGEGSVQARLPSKEPLEELRRLLLGTEQTEIVKLRERVEDPAQHAKDLSRTLPEAILLRAAQDRKLTEALTPILVEALAAAARERPRSVVDALLPVVGSAMRASVGRGFGALTRPRGRLFDGARWRIEALRSGRSVADLMLERTIVYRVEQVFLVHKRTGELLQHVTAESVAAPSADRIAATLRAIQGFAHDNGDGSSGAGRGSVQIGDIGLWIESGPHALLAAVVHGSAQSDLLAMLQSTLETLHREFGEALRDFAGGTAAFAEARPHLERCLLSKAKPTPEPEARRMPRLLWLALAAVIVVAVVQRGFFTVRDQVRWHGFLGKLAGEPGILVTQADESGGKRIVTGLRDPLAADPKALLAASGIDPGSVQIRFEPYQASHPKFVLQRAKRLLAPPPTVTMRFADGVLELGGEASHEWILGARRLSGLVPGLSSIRDDRLVDTDVREFEARRKRVESEVLVYERESSRLAQGQQEKLARLAADLEQLEDLGRSLGKSVRLEIKGHTEAGSPEVWDRQLSQQRADQILTALLSERLRKSSVVDAVGVGAKEPVKTEPNADAGPQNRSVSFAVVLEEPGAKKR